MSEQWTDEARARLESYMADDPDTFAFPEDLRAALDEIGRLETKLATAEAELAEERACHDCQEYRMLMQAKARKP